MRFETNMAPHVNLVCRTCGRVEDVEFVPEQADTMLRHLAPAAGFVPDGRRFDVYGLCRSCAAPGLDIRTPIQEMAGGIGG